MLLFNGDESIYRLFDFLYKYQFQDEPPVLYSPVSFANGSLKQIQVKSNGMNEIHEKILRNI